MFRGSAERVRADAYSAGVKTLVESLQIMLRKADADGDEGLKWGHLAARAGESLSRALEATS